MKHTSITKRFKNIIINSIIFFFITIIGITVLEISAGVIWKKKYNQWLEKQLHGFDYVDYERSIIIPTPNTKKTVSKYRSELKSHGKTIGLANFEASIQHDIPADSVVLFRINKYGFKGPEITIPKPDSIFRVMTIGNSCTWGCANDYKFFVF